VQSLAFCDLGARLSAEEKDRLFSFGTHLKAELERTGARMALVARSGLNLEALATRYSHAGIALRDSAESPWAVRQLYYDCDERRPRIFDQGLLAFVMGTDEAARGSVSILLPPADEAGELARTALDNAAALSLLGGVYSANAHAFSTRYQNCNQWVAELMAVAWGGAVGREQAQAWLRAAGYEPTRFEVGPMLALAVSFVPWMERDDHPPIDREQHRFQVSMPASIEAFVRQRLPAARRIEACHAKGQMVLREGWEPIAEGCVPQPGDRVISLR
jgi:hypothetical protein